jgi:hypothetical protein
MVEHQLMVMMMMMMIFRDGCQLASPQKMSQKIET